MKNNKIIKRDCRSFALMVLGTLAKLKYKNMYSEKLNKMCDQKRSDWKRYYGYFSLWRQIDQGPISHRIKTYNSDVEFSE